jgi:hypothetical protein
MFVREKHASLSVGGGGGWQRKMKIWWRQIREKPPSLPIPKELKDIDQDWVLALVAGIGNAGVAESVGADNSSAIVIKALR